MTPRGEGRRRRGELATVGGIAALVLVLAALVVWSLPPDLPPPAFTDAAPGAGDGGESDRRTPRSGVLERSAEAVCELAVLTSKDEASTSRVATRERIGELLDVRHCGAACDAVRALVADPDRFEVEIMKAEDYVLPPADTLDTVASGLSPGERASIGARSRVVVLRTRDAVDARQLPARGIFATALAVSEALTGLVYDETARRIETTAQTAEHAITSPLGEAVFTPRQIVVQLYRQDDGTARLLTLGMARFGSPDLTLRGATMDVAPALANVVNAVAAQIVSGKVQLPFEVSLEDVAKVSRRTPEELAREPDAAASVSLEVVTPERQAGDPVNDMVELVAPGGTTPEAWSEVVSSLFGEPPQVVLATFDEELGAIARTARTRLPSLLRRFERGEGRLFVKGPFPIPDAADGGGTAEWMWLEVTSCDAKACSGALSNTPAYASNLAAGAPAKVDRAEIGDALLRLPDGGAEGGESIGILQGRAQPR
jgi:uncharacterized protein YegJ (DUF2314 family)